MAAQRVCAKLFSLSRRYDSPDFTPQGMSRRKTGQKSRPSARVQGNQLAQLNGVMTARCGQRSGMKAFAIELHWRLRRGAASVEAPAGWELKEDKGRVLRRARAFGLSDSKVTRLTP